MLYIIYFTTIKSTANMPRTLLFTICSSLYSDYSPNSATLIAFDAYILDPYNHVRKEMSYYIKCWSILISFSRYVHTLGLPEENVTSWYNDVIFAHIVNNIMLKNLNNGFL